MSNSAETRRDQRLSRDGHRTPNHRSRLAQQSWLLNSEQLCPFLSVQPEHPEICRNYRSKRATDREAMDRQGDEGAQKDRGRRHSPDHCSCVQVSAPLLSLRLAHISPHPAIEKDPTSLAQNWLLDSEPGDMRDSAGEKSNEQAVS